MSDNNSGIEGLFSGMEGVSVRRVSPLLFHLMITYKTCFNSETGNPFYGGREPLYWNYRVKGARSDGFVFQCYARSYKEGVLKARLEISKADMFSFDTIWTVVSFDREIRKSLISQITCN